MSARTPRSATRWLVGARLLLLLLLSIGGLLITPLLLPRLLAIEGITWPGRLSVATVALTILTLLIGILSQDSISFD